MELSVKLTKEKLAVISNAHISDPKPENSITEEFLISPKLKDFIKLFVSLTGEDLILSKKLKKLLFLGIFEVDCLSYEILFFLIEL